MTDTKFYIAMACYGVLALLSYLTLDGAIRLATWVFLGGLAVKTYLATLRRDD
jgi:predicted membrane channel-forming protein YqfA (hemolysin III family)